MASPKYNIFVISPSGKADQARVMENIKYLESLGHDVTIGEYAFDSSGPFASTDENRLSDLQKAFDGNADLIWMTRGGYGLTRIIDRLKTENFVRKPKLIIGYSDITALFLEKSLANFSMCHASMLQGASFQEIAYTLELINLRSQVFKNVKSNMEFKLKTEICGGNLSLIIDQMGMTHIDFYRDKFLLIEEISEYDYKIDRMLNHLKRTGILNRVSGLLLGAFEDIQKGKIAIENFKSEMITDLMKYGMPVCYDLPIGHIENNHGILLNTPVEIEFEEGNLILNYK